MCEFFNQYAYRAAIFEVSQVAIWAVYVIINQERPPLCGSSKQPFLK